MRTKFDVQFPEHCTENEIHMDNIAWPKGENYMGISKGIEVAFTRDDEFFNEIYQTYWSATMKYFICRCPTTFDAEDLTQEVFMRVYLHMGQLRSKTTIAAWIHQIAHNTYVDSLRKKQFKTADLSVLNKPHQYTEYNQGNDIAGVELLYEIQNLLSARESQMLTERLAGYNIREIAIQHSVSPQTVKGRLYRIRKKIELSIFA